MKAFGPLMIMAEHADRERKEKLKTPFETEPARLAVYNMLMARTIYRDSLTRDKRSRNKKKVLPFVGSLSQNNVTQRFSGDRPSHHVSDNLYQIQRNLMGMFLPNRESQ